MILSLHCEKANGRGEYGISQKGKEMCSLAVQDSQ